MNLLMKGAALAPPFSCTTKYSSDVYSPRPPDIRVRLLPTKPPVHFTTEQPGRDSLSLLRLECRLYLDIWPFHKVSFSYRYLRNNCNASYEGGHCYVKPFETFGGDAVREATFETEKTNEYLDAVEHIAEGV